jgi:hypothetical protein
MTLCLPSEPVQAAFSIGGFYFAKDTFYVHASESADLTRRP